MEQAGRKISPVLTTVKVFCGSVTLSGLESVSVAPGIRVLRRGAGLGHSTFCPLDCSNSDICPEELAENPDQLAY